MRDLDLDTIANALAEARISVPLDSCKNPSIEGICESIVKLGKARDEKEASVIISRREAEKEKWLRQCAEKDLANLKAKL